MPALLSEETDGQSAPSATVASEALDLVNDARPDVPASAQGPQPPATHAAEVGAPVRRTSTGAKPSLKYVEGDVQRMLQMLPIPLHRIVPRIVVRFVAKVLHRFHFLATDVLYDIALGLLRMIIIVFFREVQPRSSWKIPAEGPIIFVGAPHHNQFLDPLLLASAARDAGRRISFLIAQKSANRPFIGRLSRMLQSIPVRRAADEAKAGRGRITVHPSGDDTLLLGLGTAFTEQLQPRGQVMLPKETGFASADVVEVISDTEVRIKKPFASASALEALRAESDDGTRGSTYKCLPHINQTDMYSSVYQQLSKGGCLCIFPEGGSHDRTDLLPLKAGVVIMALGAMANDPALDVKVVPVGLSYFHPDKFRSRAVVEFGNPMDVPLKLVRQFEAGGEGKRRAVEEMLELVYDGLKSVTVRAPDYETLMVIQASRRLMQLPGHQLSLADKVAQNRQLCMSYLQFKDHPKVLKLREAVLQYNRHLKQVGIRDHQVERANRSVVRSLALLLYRLGLLVLWGGCALPGAVLNAPIIILAKVVSARKAKEALAASHVKLYGRDVLATWKVLVSLGVTPLLYAVYAGAATYYARNWPIRLVHKCLMPLYVMTGLPVLSYGVIRISEVGVDVYKSLPPLFASLLPGRRRVIERLQQERISLAAQLHATMAELEPEGWNYADVTSMAYTARAPPAAQSTAYQKLTLRPPDSSGGHSLSHPMNLIDEWLFGWGTSHASRDTGVDGASPLASDNLGTNYDEAMEVYARRADDARRASAPDVGANVQASGAARGLSSHHRKRSSHDYRMRYRRLHVTHGDPAAPSSPGPAA